LYDQYAPKMLVLCQRYASSKEEAEDMLMEGFMNVFKSIHTFRKESDFFTWMYKVVMNTSISHQRANRRFVHEPLPDDRELEFDLVAEERIVSSLNASYILELIQKLSDLQRVVFNLKAIEGYSFEEIAAQLNQKENAIRAAYLRARRNLQEALNK
jgi:RNA polymerase sigma-70 factor (ECF subfamily)